MKIGLGRYVRPPPVPVIPRASTLLSAVRAARARLVRLCIWLPCVYLSAAATPQSVDQWLSFLSIACAVSSSARLLSTTRLLDRADKGQDGFLSKHGHPWHRIHHRHRVADRKSHFRVPRQHGLGFEHANLRRGEHGIHSSIRRYCCRPRVVIFYFSDSFSQVEHHRRSSEFRLNTAVQQ